MVTFATDYWAPALDSKARRRVTDSEGRAIQIIRELSSKPTTVTSTSPTSSSNPKRNSSLPVVNATNPIQTPFQHHKPDIISGSTFIASSSSSSSSSSTASSLAGTPCTPYTPCASEASSYLDSHHNKFDEQSINNHNNTAATTATATTVGNEQTNGHTEHKKMNFVQKLFVHDMNNSSKPISSSPVEELEEFDFRRPHDNSIFKEIKEILHPKLGMDMNYSNNYTNGTNGISSGMIRSDSGISGYGSDNCGKIADCESSLFKKYGVCDKGCIGKGATAVVRLAHKYDSSDCERIYAVKEFRKKRKNESEKDYVKKLTSEFCISSTLDHINIVKTVDFLQDENHNWCEVMEYCAGGDLYTAIKASHMTSVEINCCFKQLIMGVSYLHSMGVAHRDIKPENLLLDKNGHLKITDFGVSDVFRTCWEEEIHLSRGLCGSEPYIAPEQLETKQYDARLVDVWACGIVYYCMIYQGIPFRMATPTDPNYSNYLETRNLGLYEPFERLPRGCRELMYRILEPDVKKRIRIDEIKKDTWFKGIESCADYEDDDEPKSETKSSSQPRKLRTLTQCHKHLKYSDLT